MAQSQIHRDGHERKQAGQNHGTSRCDRRSARRRSVRGVTSGCHRPLTSVVRLLAAGSLRSGPVASRGASTVLPAPRGVHYPAPQDMDNAHCDDRACHGPDESRPTMRSSCRAPGQAQAGRPVFSVTTDRCSPHPSQRLSTAPVITRPAAYRCQRCPAGWSCPRRSPAPVSPWRPGTPRPARRSPPRGR